MTDDLVKALRAIARVQTELIAEARRQREQDTRMVNVLRGICEHLEIDLPACAEPQSDLSFREIEQLEKLLKLDPPSETIS